MLKSRRFFNDRRHQTNFVFLLLDGTLTSRKRLPAIDDPSTKSIDRDWMNENYWTMGEEARAWDTHVIIIIIVVTHIYFTSLVRRCYRPTTLSLLFLIFHHHHPMIVVPRSPVSSFYFFFLACLEQDKRRNPSILRAFEWLARPEEIVSNIIRAHLGVRALG